MRMCIWKFVDLSRMNAAHPNQVHKSLHVLDTALSVVSERFNTVNLLRSDLLWQAKYTVREVCDPFKVMVWVWVLGDLFMI